MEENKIVCRLCLKQEFQQLSILLTQVLAVKNLVNGCSRVLLKQIIKECFPFMDMRKMINATTYICLPCYKSLSQFRGLKFKFMQAELEVNERGSLKCRGCGNPRPTHKFYEFSSFHYFYTNLVHKFFNHSVKLVNLCTVCYNLINDAIPFGRQCYNTSRKIDIFIKTFKIKNKHLNMLYEVQQHFSHKLPYWDESMDFGNTFGSNSTNIGNCTRVSSNSTTTSTVPYWNFNGSTVGDNSTTNSVPNCHFIESTNVGYDANSTTHFSVPNWNFNESTFVDNNSNIGNSTTNSSVPNCHFNESTNVGYGVNSTTHSSVPNWHFNDSTNIGSTFGDNSANFGNSTGVSNNSTISGNGRQNTQIEIINLTEINIINNNNNNDDNSQGLNGTVESTTTNVVTKESTNKITDKQLGMPGNLLIKLLKKNSGTYEIEKPKDFDKPQENIVIDLTEDEPQEKAENVSENSNNYNITLNDVSKEYEEDINSKKSEKDKTKSRKRHWTGYYYNCLFGTMQLFDFEFDHKGRPLRADWDKISQAFHVPFEALGIKFDVKKGWSRLTRMSMEYLASGRVKNSIQKSILKKVIDYTSLVLPESSKGVNVVSTVEVLSSEEEEKTMDVPDNVNNNDEVNDESSVDIFKVLSSDEESTSNINSNDETSADYYKTISITDDLSSTDIETNKENSNGQETTKRKSLDLETIREEINIEELLKLSVHVGLEDILKLSTQAKKAKMKDDETVDNKTDFDVIILD